MECGRGTRGRVRALIDLAMVVMTSAKKRKRGRESGRHTNTYDGLFVWGMGMRRDQHVRYLRLPVPLGRCVIAEVSSQTGDA